MEDVGLEGEIGLGMITIHVLYVMKTTVLIAFTRSKKQLSLKRLK